MVITAAPEIDRNAAALAELAGGDPGYDAVIDGNRRRPAKTRLRSEDGELTAKGRVKLVATQRDLRRNFALARWAINKHLDYNSRFRFQSTNGDDDLDNQIEALMAGWSRRQACDVAGRHSLRRMIRLAEACRIVDGDVLFSKISSGRLQAIEGDRVRTPNRDVPRGFDPEQWTHGVRTSPSGRALEYAVCNRSKGGRAFTLAKVLPARHVCHHAWFDRFDQVRGISPLASAVNEFVDTREGFTYALARIKVSQLFGLVTFRDDEAALGAVAGAGDDGDEKPFSVDFSKGPFHLDLGPNDKAEFLQDNAPSAEFDAFTDKVITVALKALDIPFSFYNEGHTNFFGSRAALMQYLDSCEEKRADTKEVLDEVTAWRVGLWMLDGALELPAGMTLGDLKWEWVHAGTPWWDPAKDIRGDVMAVHAGFATRTDLIKKRTGRDLRDVLKQLAEEERLIKESGVTIVAPGPTIYNPENVGAPVGSAASEGQNR